MYSLKLVTFVVLSSIPYFCYGAKREDFDLQKMFEDMGEEGNKMRDECFTENEMSLADLHDYDKAEDIPEKELCFYKCFFQKSYVVDKDGKVIIESIKAIEEVKDLEESDRETFTNCLKEIKPVLECKDMVEFEKCFDQILM